MANINPGKDGNTLDSFFTSGNRPDSSFSSETLGYGFTQDVQADEANFIGTKSLFNDYAIFRFQGAAGDKNLLYDVVDQPGVTPFYSRNPSASNIISWSQEQAGAGSPFGSTPYAYADFLYCTYHAEIPNNFLVTLRRYPFPMVDNLKTATGESIPPIAQAVTWFGSETENSLKEIMKFTFGINWKEITADVQEVIGNEKGFDDGPLGGGVTGTSTGAKGGAALKSALGFLNPKEYSGQAQAESDYAQKAYGSEGPYANKVYGPVNVINKTFARDRGMKFEGDISLNFSYSLKSIGNINPKMAMLDILSNILTLTYNNAKFWGGAIRYFPQYPQVSFFGDQKAFYNGDVGGYLDSLIKDFSSMGDTFMKSFEKLLSDPLSALKELATGGARLLTGDKAAQSRPQILAMRSLLTGEPVGEWHLVVGNPMNPIAMIGNLICTDVSIEFGDELGTDDFPTEMKVNIKLKHGKPRDKGDIESMFNMGNGRMYYGIKDSIFSSTRNSNVDTSGQIGANNSGKNTDKEQTPTRTAAESANLTAHTNSTSIRSMYGNRFTTHELDITKVWAGSAPKTTKA
jgi:hypothetical protein